MFQYYVVAVDVIYSLISHLLDFVVVVVMDLSKRNVTKERFLPFIIIIDNMINSISIFLVSIVFVTELLHFCVKTYALVSSRVNFLYDATVVNSKVYAIKSHSKSL